MLKKTTSKDAELKHFQAIQLNFTAYIRNPGKNPAPEYCEARRLKIYAELFFSNVNNFLSSAFPVLKKILSDSHWTRLVRAFFENHECHSPYFRDIPREFLTFLQDEYQMTEEDPMWLLELAHYEWVELALFLAEDENEEIYASPENLLTQHPVVSKLAWPLAYHFPVHRISQRFQPTINEQQTTYLIVYRNHENKIKFVESNAVTIRLLNLLLSNETLSGESALRQIAEELQHPEPQVVIDGGLEILKNLRKKGIILGALSCHK